MLHASLRTQAAGCSRRSAGAAPSIPAHEKTLHTSLSRLAALKRSILAGAVQLTAATRQCCANRATAEHPTYRQRQQALFVEAEQSWAPRLRIHNVNDAAGQNKLMGHGNRSPCRGH